MATAKTTKRAAKPAPKKTRVSRSPVMKGTAPRVVATRLTWALVIVWLILIAVFLALIVIKMY
jgi:cell division septal protein FtsQ